MTVVIIIHAIYIYIYIHKGRDRERVRDKVDNILIYVMDEWRTQCIRLLHDNIPIYGAVALNELTVYYIVLFVLY